MGYYHIPLDLEAQKLCTTILPWVKYQYKRLPMGVKTSPDIFQRIMYELLGDISKIQVYLDDIPIIPDTIYSMALFQSFDKPLKVILFSFKHFPSLRFSQHG
jgi:hypothetical protein